jgi:dUTP pyrophosphatase
MTYWIGWKPLRESARMPVRAHDTDTGYDAFASLESPLVLAPGLAPVRVPLGFALDLPPCFGVQVRPRSSRSLAGVHVALGTVDSGYRGEICATMWSSYDRVEINDGDKVAQLVLEVVYRWTLGPTTILSETSRGERGYGSSGQ